MSEDIQVNWKDRIVYSDDGAQPQVLLENRQVRLIVAGLKAGQRIPAHPESLGIYHILEGQGWMIVDDQRLPISPGSTFLVPAGSARGMEAVTSVAFLATRIK
jgi:quercetin dioxygenase-like cupin family protein